MPLNIEYWALQTLALLITALLIPRLTISGPISGLIAVVSISLMNTYLWDAALFFSIPNHLTLHTATLLLVNGVLFWILVKVLPGIEVKGFLPALAAPVVFTITSIIIQRYGREIDWNQLATYLVELLSKLKGDFQGAGDKQSSIISWLAPYHLT